MLVKSGAVVGGSNLHFRAVMRGGTHDAFRKTRNSPGVLCSVAGAGAKPLDWDRK